MHLFLFITGEFDVYTMESALPTIDWDTIEAHLQATKEEERRVSVYHFYRLPLTLSINHCQCPLAEI